MLVKSDACPVISSVKPRNFSLASVSVEISQFPPDHDVYIFRFKKPEHLSKNSSLVSTAGWMSSTF